MISEILTNPSLQTALLTVQPLALFIAGMVIYSIFIFKAYQVIASRDVFEGSATYKNFKTNFKESSSYGTVARIILHFLEYILFFPLIVFFFFLFFFLLLIFLSKNLNMDSLMVISLAVVGAVRVTSYFSEDLSKDLAKMLPFALLGVYLVDISYFSFSESLTSLTGVIANTDLLIILGYYLLFIVVIEFVMRSLHFVYTYLFK